MDFTYFCLETRMRLYLPTCGPPTSITAFISTRNKSASVPVFPLLDVSTACLGTRQLKKKKKKGGANIHVGSFEKEPRVRKKKGDRSKRDFINFQYTQ